MDRQGQEGRVFRCAVYVRGGFLVNPWSGSQTRFGL